MILANAETPERYVKTALFNKKYAPTLFAEKYTKDNLCVISLEIKNNVPVISFDAIKNATYKLYRIEEDSQKLLKTFENVSGKQTFQDKSVCEDTTYTYFVEVLQEGEKTIKSNSVKITTKANQSQLKRIIKYW